MPLIDMLTNISSFDYGKVGNQNLESEEGNYTTNRNTKDSTEYEGVNSYYGSKLHKSIVKYRLVYSILIYLIVIYGFFNSVKSIKKKYIFLITFSYLYFLLILGWTGSTRYYASCLPFLFFFLSIGIESLIKKIKNWKLF